MKKLIAVFIVFAMLQSGFGLENNLLDSYRLKEEPRNIVADGNSIYVLNDQEVVDPKNNKTIFSTNKHLSQELDISEKHIITGTRLGNGNIVIIGRDSYQVRKIPLSFWAGSVSGYTHKGKPAVVGSAVADSRFFWANGTSIGRLGINTRAKHFSEKTLDLDRDKKSEFIVEADGARNGKIYAVEEDGAIDWETEKYEANWPKTTFNENYTLIKSEKLIEVRNSSNGQILWSRKGDITAHGLSSSSVFISKSGGMEALDAKSGKQKWKRDTPSDIQRIFEFPESRFIIGYQDTNVSLFSYSGEKLHSFKSPSTSGEPEFTDYNNDGDVELVLYGEEILEVHQLKSYRDLNVSKDYAFVGESKNIFLPLALNESVFISKENPKIVKRHSQKPLLEDKEIFARYGEIKKKQTNYYASSRPKLVYISALAAKHNASITLKREEADRDFSNHSVREIQELFIKEFEPNHVALVEDLDSEMGMLASYMAVRDGVMPAENASRAFEMIGSNERIASEGRFISVLGGHRSFMNDSAGVFSREKYLSDTEIGDLDGDGYMEAGVGRYPDNPELASVMFHRSLERDEGERALVASEYLHDSWPLVLGSVGGGMMHGKMISGTLENQGYKTERLVEHRVNVVDFLLELTPSSLQMFFMEVDELGDSMEKFVSKGLSRLLSDALVMVKALSHAEQGLELYLEHDWSGYRFDLDRGLERIQDMDLPEGKNLRKVVEQTVMKALYALVFPDKHTELTEDNLKSSLRVSDTVHYIGRSNSSAWILPNNGSALSSYYTGENNLQEVPELRDPVIVDASDDSGSLEEEMKTKLLRKGAPVFIGFSSDAYSPYSLQITRNFHRFGKKTGESARIAVNLFRESSSLVESSEPKETMENSLVHWGNPETRKDPVERELPRLEESCQGRVCTVEADLKLSEFKTSTTLIAPGEPVVPVKAFRIGSQSPEILNLSYSVESEPINGSRPEVQVYTTDGSIVNSSRQDSFPEKVVNYTENGGLKLMVAGLERSGDELHNITSANIRIRYRKPVRADIQDDKIRITSSREFDAIIYVLNSSGEFSFDRKIEKGLNAINASARHVKVYRDGFMAAEDFRPSLEKQVFVRNTSTGSTGEIRLILENEADFSTVRSFKPELPGNTVLSLGERREKTVTIEPGEKVSLSWSFTGLRPGKSELNVAGKSRDVRVDRSRSKSLINDPFSRELELDGWKTGIDVRRNSSAVLMKWRHDQKIYRYFRSPSIEVRILETPEFRIRKVEELGRKILESSEYRKVLENGRLSESGSIDRDKMVLFNRSVERGDKVFRQVTAEP
jgi:outer membrane protein assembly factor BamB